MDANKNAARVVEKGVQLAECREKLAAAEARAENVIDWMRNWKANNPNVARTLDRYIAELQSDHAALDAALEQAQQDEKHRRLYYQQIVYDVSNWIDEMLSRSVTKGQGTVSGTVDTPSNGVREGLKEVLEKYKRLSAHCANAEMALAGYEDAPELRASLSHLAAQLREAMPDSFVDDYLGDMVGSPEAVLWITRDAFRSGRLGELEQAERKERKFLLQEQDCGHPLAVFCTEGEGHCTWCESLGQARAECREELAVAEQWVDDLQSGMYINCVYCGHRYGPDDGDHLVSMRDALEAHIAICEKHPLAECRRKLAAAVEARGIEMLSLATKVCGPESITTVREWSSAETEAWKRFLKARDAALEQATSKLREQLAAAEAREQGAVNLLRRLERAHYHHWCAVCDAHAEPADTETGWMSAGHKNSCELLRVLQHESGHAALDAALGQARFRRYGEARTELCEAAGIEAAQWKPGSIADLTHQALEQARADGYERGCRETAEGLREEAVVEQWKAEGAAEEGGDGGITNLSKRN
jgi:hypothetical protein